MRLVPIRLPRDEPGAALLEIDLLRAGRRPSLATPLPPHPYFVFLSRVALRPQVAI